MQCIEVRWTKWSVQRLGAWAECSVQKLGGLSAVYRDYRWTDHECCVQRLHWPECSV